MKSTQSISGVPRSNWPVPFFVVWSGQSLAMITSETVQFAIIWWLTATFNSATVVSIATMMALLPRALLSPFMGAIVDRSDRKLVLIASHVVIIISLVCLRLFFLTGTTPAGIIYAIVFLCACSKSFQMPAMLASTALMVPQKHISHIAGLNQMLQGIMRVAAPALGALLINTLPMYAIVIIDIAGAFFAIISLLFISIPNPMHMAGADTPVNIWKNLWKDVCDGLGLIKNWRGAKEMLFISTMVNFLSCPAFMLISILVTQHFNGTERQFAWISAAIGVGMICGGMAFSFWGGFRRPMQTSLVGVIGMGFALLVTGIVSESFVIVAIGSMFIGGFMIPITMAPIQALVQKTVEPVMQGRILALLDSISTAISPISLAIAGQIFDYFGPQSWYVTGSLFILLIGIVGLCIPQVMNLGLSQSSVGYDNVNTDRQVFPKN